MQDMVKALKEIETIDRDMASLFEKRMQAYREIAEYKKERGMSVQVPGCEPTISADGIADAELKSYYLPFADCVQNIAEQYQTCVLSGMRVIYSGVEGAFAHIAAKQMFPSAKLISLPDFSDAYRAVEAGEYDCVVLPIENSYAGDVGNVMDLMFSGSLYVNQILELPIRHNLMCLPDADPTKIKTVVSHPQALAQCAEYIHSHGYDTLSYSNTAAAAKYVASCGDPTMAAIASDETAEIFGLKIVESRIQTQVNNTTRFAAFSRVQNKPVPNNNREDELFLLMFTVRNAAGALAQTLNIIGAHGFNMRSLQSRPMKELQWSYYFYIEAEGKVNTENGRDMLRELSAVCARLKLVGSYYAGKA